MFSLTRTTLTALALLNFSGVEAFWRVNCALIQRGRIDPLVNPGTVATHNHAIVGGSNIGVNSTFQSLIDSECTSCEVASDKSAYWTPTLYYNYANGSFYEVPHTGSVIYYLGRGPNVNNTIPFPKGLNMLSGDKSARSYDNQTYTWGNDTYPGRPISDRVSFNCLDEDGPFREQPYMFRTKCAYGLRAQIHFQTCWNSKDLYAADNSHVAYLSSIDDGICPPTHPLQLPHLFMETLWAVADVPGQNDGGRFVFSQGDPTGYGFHGDFQDGWEVDALATATKDCLSNAIGFGTIQECPILQSTQSDGYPYNCPERPPQVGELITGLLSKLPGCITITDGPEAAPAASMECAAGVPRPSITKTVDSLPQATSVVQPGTSFGISREQVYKGCYNDTAGVIHTLNSVSMSNYTAMTVEFCQTWCNNQGYRLSGVEYGRECHCDNAMLSTATTSTAILGHDECNWNCGGTMTTGGTQEQCGGNQWIGIYNNTDPGFPEFGDNSNSAGQFSAPTALAPFPSNYLGCATDQQGGARALTGISVQQLNMSSQACASYCSSGNGGRGYQYYGTEYGSQCFCGDALTSPNYITSATTTVTNATCNMHCSGAGDQLCGGPNAISLYKNNSYVAPGIKDSVGKYLSKQCLTDPNGAGGRALQGFKTMNPKMTVEYCVKFCSGKMMHYAGVEYGSECYCGNSIPDISGATTKTCPIDILMLCGGDSTEYCGGPSLMNLYYAATL